jgi:aspartate ammonia-lyase
MASVEAQLQAAQIELRRTNNTMAVVLLQVGKADDLIAEFQDMMNRFAMTLHGDIKKTALLMEKRCQDWRTAQQRIQL